MQSTGARRQLILKQVHNEQVALRRLEVGTRETGVVSWVVMVGSAGAKLKVFGVTYYVWFSARVARI